MKLGVLVTGGAGFIGSHLVDSLIESDKHVTVLDDFSTGERRNLEQAERSGRLQVVTGSILDVEAVRQAMEGNRTVFHLAVQCVRRSLGNPVHNHHVNATGTLNVLEAARAQGVARFVYCSSSEVYGSTSDGLLDEDSTVCRPTTVYGAAKLAGELYADAYRQTYGLPVVIVRPFNAYGPRAHEQGDLAEVIPRFFVRVLNGQAPVVFGDGSNGRDFTYVTDVARGLRLAGSSDRLLGAKINIAYGQMVTVREIADLVMKACGRNDLRPTFSRARPGDIQALRANVQRATDLLDYRAEIAVEPGIRRYLDWFLARHPDPSKLLEERIENWTMPPQNEGART